LLGAWIRGGGGGLRHDGVGHHCGNVRRRALETVDRVGVAAVVFASYSTLQIWNPKTTIVCSQRNLYPGSEFEISWLHQVSSSSISEFTIELEGQESATYRQGTTTRTEKHSFFKKTIVKTSDSSEIAKGFRLMKLPDETMHTFEGQRNTISWQSATSPLPMEHNPQVIFEKLFGVALSAEEFVEAAAERRIFGASGVKECFALGRVGESLRGIEKSFLLCARVIHFRRGCFHTTPLSCAVSPKNPTGKSESCYEAHRSSCKRRSD
jgi:hypothetical protein